jgi:hypothetical protein
VDNRASQITEDSVPYPFLLLGNELDRKDVLEKDGTYIYIFYNVDLVKLNRLRLEYNNIKHNNFEKHLWEI